MQTTTISWALEFLAGFILMLTYILVEERDEFTDFMILLPVVCLNFILIPASYLMMLVSWLVIMNFPLVYNSPTPAAGGIHVNYLYGVSCWFYDWIKWGYMFSEQILM